MNATPAFISLKDHKQDFENHPKVSKSIIDNINNKIRAHTHVNQWRNSTDAISWFQTIQKKKKNILFAPLAK